MRPKLILSLLAGTVLLSVAGCSAWRTCASAGDGAAKHALPAPAARCPGAHARRRRQHRRGHRRRHPVGQRGGVAGAGLPPRLWENRAQDGATIAGAATQLQHEGRFDLVLVLAGGNDVLRLRAANSLKADIARTVRLARERADVVVLMPAGNVGNAPFFFPPVSWEMTRRSRTLHRLIRAAAAEPGVVYVGLFRERADDPFVRRPELNARDGLHPSDAGYREWYATLTAQAGLDERLAAARRVDR